MKRPPDFAPIIYNATISHQWNCSIIIYSTAYIVPSIVYYPQLEWPQPVCTERCCTAPSAGHFLAPKCYHLTEAAMLSARGWIQIAWISCPHFCESFRSIWVALRGVAPRLHLFGGCFLFLAWGGQAAAPTLHEPVQKPVRDGGQGTGTWLCTVPRIPLLNMHALCGAEDLCKPQPCPPYSGRSRLQLLNLGFRKKVSDWRSPGIPNGFSFQMHYDNCKWHHLVLFLSRVIFFS